MSLLKQPQKPSEADQLKDITSQCVLNMKMAAGRSHNILWHSKDKTPQQIIDDLGEDAALALQAHSDLQDLIAKVDPSYVRLNALKPITVVNGKLTVGA